MIPSNTVLATPMPMLANARCTFAVFVAIPLHSCGASADFVFEVEIQVAVVVVVSTLNGEISRYT